MVGGSECARAGTLLLGVGAPPSLAVRPRVWTQPRARRCGSLSLCVCLGLRAPCFVLLLDRICCLWTAMDRSQTWPGRTPPTCSCSVAVTPTPTCSPRSRPGRSAEVVAAAHWVRRCCLPPAVSYAVRCFQATGRGLGVQGLPGKSPAVVNVKRTVSVTSM